MPVNKVMEDPAEKEVDRTFKNVAEFEQQRRGTLHWIHTLTAVLVSVSVGALDISCAAALVYTVLSGCWASQHHAMCISAIDLQRQLCMLPHWQRSCRSNKLSHQWQSTQINVPVLALTIQCKVPGALKYWFLTHWYDLTMVSGEQSPDLPPTRCSLTSWPRMPGEERRAQTVREEPCVSAL